jgi:hypothetical protein
LRLIELGVPKDVMGYYFAILPIFYMLAGIIMQYYPKYIDNRVYLIMIGYLNTTATLFNGPSKFLRFPNELWYVIIG